MSENEDEEGNDPIEGEGGDEGKQKIPPQEYVGISTINKDLDSLPRVGKLTFE